MMLNDGPYDPCLKLWLLKCPCGVRMKIWALALTTNYRDATIAPTYLASSPILSSWVPEALHSSAHLVPFISSDHHSERVPSWCDSWIFLKRSLHAHIILEISAILVISQKGMILQIMQFGKLCPERSEVEQAWQGGEEALTLAIDYLVCPLFASGEDPLHYEEKQF